MYRMWAWAMKRPKVYERLAKAAAIAAPRGDSASGWIKDLLASWPRSGRRLAARARLARPATKSFRELWRERKKP